MILGIGTDIVEISRIEKLLTQFETRFAQRCFTAGEIAYCDSKRDHHARMSAYAKRYAAKEACAKALGFGIGANAELKDIEVSNDIHGAPALVLHGKAYQTLQNKIPEDMDANLHLSLSDEKHYAQAFVILDASEEA